MNGQFEKYFDMKVREQMVNFTIFNSDSVVEGLIKKSQKLYIRYLILAMSESKYTNIISKEQGYAEFQKELILNDKQVLGQDLANKISIQIKKKLEDVLEVEKNLHKNKIDIEKRFNITLSNIRVKFGQGDTHNKGKEVLLLEYNKHQLLYKPTLFEGISSYNAIQEHVGSLLGINVNSVDFKNYDSFSIHEFINSTSLLTKSDATQYYYNYGFLIAISYLLGSVDLHNENIVINNIFPTIIDFETMYSGIRKTEEFGGGDSDFEHIALFESLLLPSNILSFSNVNIDFSPLNNKSQSIDKNISATYIANLGRSDMCIKTAVAGVWNNKNSMPYLNGKPVYFDEYITNIISGFKETLLVVYKNKDTVLKLLNKIDNINIRTIHRPTMLYDKLLTALNHPDYKNSSKKRELLDVLKNTTIPEDMDIYIEEEKQLLREDIPYFITKYYSNNIFTNEGKLLRENYLTHSPYDKSKFRLEHLSLESVNMYSQIVKLTLELNKKDVFGNSEQLKIEKSFKEFSRDYICDIKKKLSNKYTLYPTQIADDRLALSFYYNGVYEMGGLTLLLLEEYKLKKSREICEIISKTQNNKIASNNNISAFHGLGSDIYIKYQLYKNNIPCIFDLNKHLNDELYVLEEKIYECHEYDFIGGIAGVLTLLCNIYEDSSKWGKILIRNIKLCTKKIIEGVDLSKVTIGFGHGFSGISYALYKSLFIIEDENVKKFAKVLLKKEDEFYSNNGWKNIRMGTECNYDANYWCYGDIGCIFTRIESAKTLNYTYKIPKFEEIKVLVENDSLCHGKVGNLQIIKEIYAEENEYKMLSERVYDEIFKNGYVNGTKINMLYDNFMNSIPGAIYYSYKNAPNVMIMEV